jgi:hypothetical protein
LAPASLVATVRLVQRAVRSPCEGSATNEIAVTALQSQQSRGCWTRRRFPFASVPPSVIVIVTGFAHPGQSYATCIKLTRLPMRLTSEP